MIKFRSNKITVYEDRPWAIDGFLTDPNTITQLVAFARVDRPLNFDFAKLGQKFPNIAKLELWGYTLKGNVDLSEMKNLKFLQIADSKIDESLILIAPSVEAVFYQGGDDLVEFKIDCFSELTPNHFAICRNYVDYEKLSKYPHLEKAIHTLKGFSRFNRVKEFNHIESSKLTNLSLYYTENANWDFAPFTELEELSLVIDENTELRNPPKSLKKLEVEWESAIVDFAKLEKFIEECSPLDKFDFFNRSIKASGELVVRNKVKSVAIYHKTKISIHVWQNSKVYDPENSGAVKPCLKL